MQWHVHHVTLHHVNLHALDVTYTYTRYAVVSVAADQSTHREFVGYVRRQNVIVQAWSLVQALVLCRLRAQPLICLL